MYNLTKFYLHDKKKLLENQKYTYNNINVTILCVFFIKVYHTCNVICIDMSCRMYNIYIILLTIYLYRLFTYK